MEEFMSSVSLKGQVTIPVKIRERLDIHPRDKVTFILDDDHVQIIAARVSLDSLYRSVPALKQPLSDEEMTTIAAEEHALHVIREG